MNINANLRASFFNIVTLNIVSQINHLICNYNEYISNLLIISDRLLANVKYHSIADGKLIKNEK